MQSRFDEFLKRLTQSDQVNAIVEAEKMMPAKRSLMPMRSLPVVGYSLLAGETEKGSDGG